MEEKTLVAFAIILFLFLAIVKDKGTHARRKEWMHLVFQQEARRAHGQYHNLVRELSLDDREYYFS